MFPFEFIYEMVYETVVKVLTTQVSVTGGGLDLEDTLLDSQERNIECSTTQVEDQNGEGDERGRRPVALIVCDDFDAVISKDADAGVGGAQIDTDCWCHGE